MSVAFEYGGIDRDPVRWVDRPGPGCESLSGNGSASEGVAGAPAEDASRSLASDFEVEPTS